VSNPISLIDPRGDAPRVDGSLAERAYTAIRDRIVTLRFAPGALLQEDALMRALNLGRTPVREALLRLEGDNLVTVLPRRGTFVSEINITDLAQIAEIRAQLEGFAAALAARRARVADHAEIDLLLAEDERLDGSRDHEALIDLDQRVHHFVYRGARNSFLEDTLTRYYHLSLRMWFLVLDRVPHLDTAVHEHRDLLLAIRDGDEGRALAVAQQHVVGFEAQIRKVI